MIGLRPVVVVLVAVCLSGCGLLKKKLLSRKYSPVPKEEAQKQDVFIGMVESVNPEQKFVLIRMETRMAIAPGTKLETRPINGPRTTLVVTPEHKMNFLSADTGDGLPNRGDLVVLPRQSAGAMGLTPPGTAPAPAAAPVMELPLPQANAPGSALPVPGVPPDSLPLPVR